MIAPRHSEPANWTGRSRNLVVLGVDMALFSMAMGFIGPQTLLPLLVGLLSGGPLLVGVLAAVLQLGRVPQLLTAGAVERTSRTVRWVLIFDGLERVMVLGLTLVTLSALALPSGTAVALILLFAFGQSVHSGLATTPWMDLYTRSAPAAWRNRLMGLYLTVGSLLGALAAALSAPLLTELPFPGGFAASFALGSFVLLVGYLVLCFVREPPPTLADARRRRPPLREVLAVLWTDRGYARFQVGLAANTLALMSASFLALYGVQRLGAEESLAGWFTACLLGAQAVSHLLLGWLADHRGLPWLVRASALATLGMAALALLAQDPLWLLPAFVALGLAHSGNMLCRLTGPATLAPPGQGPRYLALTSALQSTVGAIGPLLAAGVVAGPGFDWLFAVSGGLALLSLAVSMVDDNAGNAPRR